MGFSMIDRLGDIGLFSISFDERDTCSLIDTVRVYSSTHTKLTSGISFIIIAERVQKIGQ